MTKCITVILLVSCVPLLGLNAGTTEFSGISEKEAWLLLDSVRAEKGWLEYEQVSPLARARNVNWNGCDVLIVYFKAEDNKTVEVRIDLCTRIAEVDFFEHNPPSIEEVENFFDDDRVDQRLGELFPNTALTERHLCYAGAEASSDFIFYYGLYWAFYDISDFAQYLFLIDGTVRKKTAMQLEYMKMIQEMEESAGRK